MTVLYSDATCPFSQCCRPVLLEEGMDPEIRDADFFDKSEDIAVMNPHNQVFILAERDPIPYELNIINEYIDERFPRPQSMLVDPTQHARARLLLFSLEKELFTHMSVLGNRKDEAAKKNHERARATIHDRPTQPAPIFLKDRHMLGEKFSTPDVAIVLLLWRLDYCGTRVSKSAAPLMKYTERTLSHPAYIEALTPSEKVMRR